jgi:protein-L-isoaspartate(D-aspartate) O-methyltransferase
MFGRKSDPQAARAQMVQKQLVQRDIVDPHVLKAMGEVPRHQFVEPEQQEAAYADKPLPIGYGQTISQPYIVAFMTQALKLPPDEATTVLEIGTGSGYQAAILSRVAGRVFSVERLTPLAEQARERLWQLGISNVEIKVSDGGYGWPENGPYDGILVTAAAPEIPAPLLLQLKEGARLIVPVGPMGYQDLVCLQRRGEEWVKSSLAPVAFVPLLGEHGWSE